jgi:hypothetical protein
MNTRTVVAFCVVCGWLLVPNHGYGQARTTVPDFKIVSTGFEGGRLSIVVPPDTTDAQLAALINRFRTARASGSLAQLIPPTTPRGNRGPYAAVEIFVFSDPAWATAARLNAFMHPTTRGITAGEKAFGAHIRAYYLAPLAGDEFGSIGYESDGYKYSADFRKLF